MLISICIIQDNISNAFYKALKEKKNMLKNWTVITFRYAKAFLLSGIAFAVFQIIESFFILYISLNILIALIKLLFDDKYSDFLGCILAFTNTQLG